MSSFADKQQVDIEEDKKQNGDRSISMTPVVYIDTDLCQLSIAFTAQNDAYNLLVTDRNGNTVYQSMVITDGANHSYDLPVLDSGYYELKIEGGNKKYNGGFEL